MKKIIRDLSILCFVLILPLTYADTVSDTFLATWGFNFNGTVQTGNNPDVPGAPPAGWGANYSGFDFNAGFGTITFTFTGAPGTYSFLAFFDHDIGPFPLDSNTGLAFGAPVAGQSWQLGPPGYPGDGGDTFFMFEGNTLKNLNEIEPGEYGDISAALGWEFALNPGDNWYLTLSVGTTTPGNGFYLSEFDAATGDTLYIYGNASASPPSEIPEPGTLVLLGSGLVSAAGAIRRRLQS